MNKREKYMKWIKDNEITDLFKSNKELKSIDNIIKYTDEVSNILIDNKLIDKDLFDVDYNEMKNIYEIFFNNIQLFSNENDLYNEIVQIYLKYLLCTTVEKRILINLLIFIMMQLISAISVIILIVYLMNFVSGLIFMLSMIKMDLILLK